MRVLAIGDIHGCYRALETVVEAASIGPDDTLITLGDYIDRGPDSRSVLDWLIRRQTEGILIPLVGNHEKMMLNARLGKEYFETWLGSGGRAALDSYHSDSLDAVPSAHWRFLEGCRTYYEMSSHFFVHANAFTEIDLADQPEYMLYCESLDDHPQPHHSGRVMVCGHTPQKKGKPWNLGHTVCIDTYAHGGGWLTCLDIASGECWQGNQKGKSRQFTLARSKQPH